MLNCKLQFEEKLWLRRKWKRVFSRSSSGCGVKRFYEKKKKEVHINPGGEKNKKSKGQYP